MEKTKGKKEKKLVKIAYFDEQAAVDILEVLDGGVALETLNKKFEKGISSDINGKVGINISGILGMGLSGNAKKGKNTIIQNQVTSTLVSQFIKKIDNDEIELLVVEAPELKIQKESNAYFRNLLPMTRMIKDFSALEGVDHDSQQALEVINFDQLGESFDSLSAYYEMEGTLNGRPAIYRFNIDGLRNNYSLSDIAKMDLLKLYGIRIGSRSNVDLTFDKEIEDMISDNQMEYSDYDQLLNNGKSNCEEKYPVIDIILAGIEA